MDNDRASKNELNRASSFRFLVCLALVFGNSDIVPKMKIATLHFNELTEFFKIPFNVETVELRRVAAMKIKDQFVSVSFACSTFFLGHDLPPVVGPLIMREFSGLGPPSVLP